MDQKALMGTFMGGLEPEIAKGIQMFKPKTLKEAISLARMKDDQLSHQKKTTCPSITSISNTTSSIAGFDHEATQLGRGAETTNSRLVLQLQ